MCIPLSILMSILVGLVCIMIGLDGFWWSNKIFCVSTEPPLLKRIYNNYPSVVVKNNKISSWTSSFWLFGMNVRCVTAVLKARKTRVTVTNVRWAILTATGDNDVDDLRLLSLVNVKNSLEVEEIINNGSHPISFCICVFEPCGNIITPGCDAENSEDGLLRALVFSGCL